MGLLGSGSSGSRGKIRIPAKGHTPNAETDPSRSGNPDQIDQRDAIAQQGQALRKANSKSRSTGIKLGGRGIKR